MKEQEFDPEADRKLRDLRSRPLVERYPWAKIGEGSYGGLIALRWDNKTQLTIGKYCSFSFDVKVMLGGEHRTDWVTTFPFSVLWPAAKDIEGHPTSKGDVVIGNDVWVGAEAFILSGVTIGDGAVVAARTVVHQDVPPYAIVAGSPAKVLRYRFESSTVAQLLKLKWWDWPQARIERALPFMLSNNLESFLTKAACGIL